MHSGKQKLGGGTEPNQTDRQRLMVAMCPRGTIKLQNITLKNGKTELCGRYVCSAADIGRDDTCYLLYVNDKVERGNNTVKIRLGYADLLRGDAK